MNPFHISNFKRGDIICRIIPVKYRSREQDNSYLGEPLRFVGYNANCIELIPLSSPDQSKRIKLNYADWQIGWNYWQDPETRVTTIRHASNASGNIDTFCSGQIICRVSPIFYSNNNPDNSFLGEPFRFEGFANNHIVLSPLDGWRINTIGNKRITLYRDLWADGWELWKNPETECTKVCVCNTCNTCNTFVNITQQLKDLEECLQQLRSYLSNHK